MNLCLKCIYDNLDLHICEPLTKNKKRLKNIKETGDSQYIYQNELGQACF